MCLKYDVAQKQSFRLMAQTYTASTSLSLSHTHARTLSLSILIAETNWRVSLLQTQTAVIMDCHGPFQSLASVHKYIFLMLPEYN